MTPAPASSGASPAAQALPPLPDFGQGGTSPEPGGPQGLAALVAGIAPVKAGVDAILAAVKQIVSSQAVPGAETVCGQIAALATSLLPMAAQAAMMPQGPQGMSSGPQGPQGGGPQ